MCEIAVKNYEKQGGWRLESFHVQKDGTNVRFLQSLKFISCIVDFISLHNVMFFNKASVATRSTTFSESNQLSPWSWRFCCREVFLSLLFHLMSRPPWNFCLRFQIIPDRRWSRYHDRRPQIWSHSVDFPSSEWNCGRTFPMLSLIQKWTDWTQRWCTLGNATSSTRQLGMVAVWPLTAPHTDVMRWKFEMNGLFCRRSRQYEL